MHPGRDESRQTPVFASLAAGSSHTAAFRPVHQDLPTVTHLKIKKIPWYFLLLFTSWSDYINQ